MAYSVPTDAKSPASPSKCTRMKNFPVAGSRNCWLSTMLQR